MNTDRRTGFCVRPKVDRPDASPGQFQRFLAEHGIRHVVSRRKNPPTRGTLERRWYEYDRHRGRFATQREFIEWHNAQIHDTRWLAMYKSPGEAFRRKLPPEVLLGLHLRQVAAIAGTARPTEILPRTPTVQVPEPVPVLSSCGHGGEALNAPKPGSVSDECRHSSDGRAADL